MNIEEESLQMEYNDFLRLKKSMTAKMEDTKI